MRLIPAGPTCETWIPHAYQERASRFLQESNSAALFLDPGLGKAMPVDTPVYTPDGWRALGALRPGDLVYAVDGRPTRVEGVYPQTGRKCLRVTFSDHTSALCSPDHLWAVAPLQLPAWSRGQDEAWKVMRTEDLAGNLRKNNRARWRVPIAEAVEHGHAELPLHPYALGMLLVDGTFGENGSLRVSISPRKEAMLTRLRAATEDVFGCRWRPKVSSTGYLRVELAEGARLLEAVAGLRKETGRCIPRRYMRASVPQRKQLLRGIMDGGGSVCAKGPSQSCVFTARNPRLAADVAELVRSLGGLATESAVDQTRSGGAFRYRVSIRTRFCPFLEHERAAGKWRAPRIARSIVSIDEAPDAGTVCIKVAHPRGLFLVNDFLVTHNTSIVLDAFDKLRREGSAERALVVAPLRVCQLVWRQEAARWSQFRHLTFSFLHGDWRAKQAALRAGADITLINPEGVPWLADRCYPKPIPFDTLVVDELTKFKSASGVRHKRLRARLAGVKRRWGLTGTPVPNGYLDLFGQFLLLDDGAALGKYITAYRDKYFQTGWNGFDYRLREGAAEAIEQRIAPYVLRMRAEDYLSLPALVDDIRHIELDARTRKLYNQMRDEMLAEVPGGVVTAANAGVVYAKLKQMANGAVYVDSAEGDVEEAAGRKFVLLHDAKLDALEELVDELAGQPLLVAYEFRSDLARLLKRFGENTPYLGAGVSGKRVEAIENAWNRGELPLLFIHPGSVGHGVNLQRAGAAHIAWFSATWSLDLYDQTIRRIYRQGNTSTRVVNHLLIVADTVDVLQLEALRDKDMTQKRLLGALNAKFFPDAAGVTAAKEQDEMSVQKLSRQDGSAWGLPAKTAEEDEAPVRVRAPAGWGGVAQRAAEDDENGEQRERIRSRLRNGSAPAAQPPEEEDEAPVAAQARGAFSEAVQRQMQGTPLPETAAEPSPDEPVKRGRGRPPKTEVAKGAPTGISITAPEGATGQGIGEFVRGLTGPRPSEVAALVGAAAQEPEVCISLTLNVPVNKAGALFAALAKL